MKGGVPLPFWLKDFHALRPRTHRLFIAVQWPEHAECRGDWAACWTCRETDASPRQSAISAGPVVVPLVRPAATKEDFDQLEREVAAHVERHLVGVKDLVERSRQQTTEALVELFGKLQSQVTQDMPQLESVAPGLLASWSQQVAHRADGDRVLPQDGRWHRCR